MPLDMTLILHPVPLDVALILHPVPLDVALILHPVPLDVTLQLSGGAEDASAVGAAQCAGVSRARPRGGAGV